MCTGVYYPGTPRSSGYRLDSPRGESEGNQNPSCSMHQNHRMDDAVSRPLLTVVGYGILPHGASASLGQGSLGVTRGHCWLSKSVTHAAPQPGGSYEGNRIQGLRFYIDFI